VVFGSAAAAGVIAPTLAAVAENLAAPHVFVGMASLAALAQLGALTAAMRLPPRGGAATHVTPNNPADWRVFTCATFAGALAWFAMAALMAAAPLAMAGCGLASTIVVGAISWHVVAMYAPSLILARLPAGLTPALPAFGGVIIVALAAALFQWSTTSEAFSVSLILLGIGWSFATTGATLWIHRGGTPPRWLLPAHDFVLFASAVAGAAIAGRIVI
jgi:hypothetical protein